ncbi:MAG: lysophospholipid acyltransferase family protein [Gemmatales bacterium]|nr:1-acyl-sn-glycerol-3-phosphate acyltransferase [Gemmatales bacterium]MDW7994728.1 lysophospholipid acyltransferase family protein [Gemmatales bacterium]
MLATRGELIDFDGLAGGLALLSAAYGLVLAGPFSGRSVRRWALCVLALLQAAMVALLAWGAFTEWMLGSAVLGFWIAEWLCWLVRLMRSGALARELDVYPGLVVAMSALAWLAGWYLVTLVPMANFLFAVLVLLLSSLLGTRLDLRFEKEGPEALSGETNRLWFIIPDMRLSSWQDTREAFALVLGTAAYGVVSGMNWQDYQQTFLFGRAEQGEVYAALRMFALPLLAGLIPLFVANHPVRVSGWLPYLAWLVLVAVSVPAKDASVTRGWASLFVQSSCWCAVLASGARLIALCPPSALAGWLALAQVATWGAMYLGYWLDQQYQVSPWAKSFLVAGGALVIQLYWLREWMELTAAPLAWLIYRIRHVGPGHQFVPWRGPLVVIANHAAWFDPLWLGKVIPRRLTPMMTSEFYDRPGLYWLMRYVLRVIRVQASAARQEVPELDEAISRLDQGECLLIFPEGRLRRDEQRFLAPFQRGIWLLLQKRPNMPVVPCWIEGNWGSFFSWRGGPPMQGKPFDWGRVITIAIGQPLLIPPDVLADHRTTRRYLEGVVLKLREHIVVHSPNASVSTHEHAASAAESRSLPSQLPEIGRSSEGANHST